SMLGCGDSGTPVLTTVMPKSLCANVETTLTLTGTDLEPGSVLVGDAVPDGGAAAVMATTVTGSPSILTPPLAPNTLTPRDKLYDVPLFPKDCNRVTLPEAVTVVPGISIAAVDPAAAYSGVDFPVSVYGTGLGGVVKVSIDLGGTKTDLVGVTPVDPN